MKTFLKKGILLSLCLCFAWMVAGCSNSSSSTGTATDLPYKSAVELLDAIWNADADSEKPKIVGGAGDSMKENAPEALNLSDPALLAVVLAVPETLPGESESAACLMNAMMANALTASVWQLKDGTDMKAIAQEVSKTVQQSQWVCTTPEVYQILTCGNFLILVFGYESQVDGLVKGAESVLGSEGLETLFNEPISV